MFIHIAYFILFLAFQTAVRTWTSSGEVHAFSCTGEIPLHYWSHGASSCVLSAGTRVHVPRRLVHAATDACISLRFVVTCPFVSFLFFFFFVVFPSCLFVFPFRRKRPCQTCKLFSRSLHQAHWARSRISGITRNRKYLWVGGCFC